MKKQYKVIVSLIIFVLMVAGYFLSLQNVVSDSEQIEQELKKLNHEPSFIHHMEFIDNYAIVFYNWGSVRAEKMAVAEFKKGWAGWTFVSGYSADKERDLKDIELQSVNVLYGKERSADVVVATDHTEELAKQMDDAWAYWYLVSEEHDYSQAQVKWLDGDGTLLKEAQLGQSD
ncbi:hypothetical protein HXZ66_19635 [Bacillus sp. A116_S68]|nr:hypothetical protein HXZ66_19635 [Bacillus sp. A116_S68]